MEASMALSDPQSMPELEREMTILNGSITSLESRIDELLLKLQPLMSDEPQTDTPPLAEIPTRPPIRTPIGRQLNEASSRVGHMENRLARAISRSAL